MLDWRRARVFLAAMLVVSLLFAGCASDNDDDDDDLNDDDDADDDDLDDDDSHDGPANDPASTIFPNPQARADAFGLFYRERSLRALLALNRFGLSGDAVFAEANGKNYYAKDGDAYEVVPGPNDNNPFGMITYTTWELYQSLGGRELELTLIRLFEGLLFAEQVSGHWGLTNREALPGWTRVMDGVNDEVLRTRNGEDFDTPVPYPAALEQEVLDTFFEGVHFTYRENPEEYYFNFKPINEFTSFAHKFVFHELPMFLRASDCCSSLMKTPEGYLWEGAFWGNHNSRDNFTDYAMGYLAAMEAVNTPGLPDDLAQAAQHALDAGTRTCNRIVEAGMVQLTVDEHHDYDFLIPGGFNRPDGHREIEWQDLGSLASCTMVFTAQAISGNGLSHPVPPLPMPGDPVSQALQHLFNLLGIPALAPIPECVTVDDAFIGFTWKGLLEAEVLGMPWYEFAELISLINPELLTDLIGSTADDFQELMLGAVCLCYFSQISGDEKLYLQSRDTLAHLVEVTYILTDLVYGVKSNAELDQRVVAAMGQKAADEKYSRAEELYYLATLWGRMFNIDTDFEHLGGFAIANSRIASVEAHLSYGDTAPKPLMTDQQMWDTMLDSETGYLWNREPWIQERYLERFGYTVPVRRAGEGYEAIGIDGQWQATENDRHRWFGPGKLWYEAPLCAMDVNHTLDCYWAALGCAPADLDNSGTADGDDLILFEAAWAQYGNGAQCSSSNDWCDHADLDQNGVLDADDQGYIQAAQGCVR
ncbi:MAG: hypothetical protein P9M14_06350 [Candidatus Alcyoniella australis]|nr:hypothetical protein [Candidatus Alcyoniella australis]